MTSQGIDVQLKEEKPKKKLKKWYNHFVIWKTLEKSKVFLFLIKIESFKELKYN
jgi:hypothetical protein